MKRLIATAACALIAGACAQTPVRDRVTLENPFGNALVPDMIADASIEEIDGTFYCYATTDGYGRGLDTSGPPVVWKSKDFVNWSFDGTYFPQAEFEKYWAPSKAVQYKGKWYIYPTVNGFMYPAVADSPDGPFSLIKGDSFITENRLIPLDGVHYIDAEIFIDDDDTPYVFWGSRHVAKLNPDMASIDSIRVLETRQKAYSEGPIFFKRKGIYYYLYTIGGSETYKYYYMMSRTSPLGPWETPEQDLVSITDYETGVFGPGHGCVFNLEGTDDYYFAFLEFSRNSTNRQTYVNPLVFNDDGTIRQVKVTLDGVGALHKVQGPGEILPVGVEASSTAPDKLIRYFNDEKCQRTEKFGAEFALDSRNGSRWMPAADDSAPWLTVDLGRKRRIGSSELYFVRPTAGHSYVLEGSADGKKWKEIAVHTDMAGKSPNADAVGRSYRYLRVKINEGEAGLWEWKLYR